MIAGAAGIQGGHLGGQPTQNYSTLYGQKQNLKAGGANVYGDTNQIEES